ncbi:hypothetical protein MASR1M36_03320 [Candidatus Cloacimonadaceae bacterium]
MKSISFILALLLLIFVFSCSGDDPIDTDTVAPVAPTLIPHLGDTGDDPIIVDGHNVFLNDDINGIDAVSEGNWIKVPWDPFVDSDLSHVKVYRFSQSNPEPVLVNTIPAAEDYYLDQSSLVEREWYSYFIELYDAAGNFSVSDTVSYALLAKSNLVYPGNGEAVNPSGMNLIWNRGDSDTSRFRVLVWDDTDRLIYSPLYFYAPTQENPPPPQVPFPNLTPAPVSGQVFRWRVDAFDWDEEMGMYMGSESTERSFVIQ